MQRSKRSEAQASDRCLRANLRDRFQSLTMHRIRRFFDTHQREAGWVGIAVLACLLVWFTHAQLAAVGDWRVDDAYITFSFSKNLATGHGPTFSHGVRVEGYSNFLWMLVMAVGYVFRHDLAAYGAARVLSVILLALMAVGVWRLCRRRAGWVASAAVLLVLAHSTDLARATMSGLETVPYAAVLTLATVWYLEESPDRPWRWSLFGFVLVALMRIDGFVPLLYVIGFELVESHAAKRLHWRRFATWLAPVLVYAAWFVWQWRYYGLPLPTTYYAKTLVDADDPYRASTYAWDFVRALGLQALLPFALIAVARRPARDTVFVALLVVGHGAYVLQTGGDWMPFWRFFIPVLPLVMVLAAWGLSEAWRTCRSLPAWTRAVPALVAGWCCVFSARHADATTVDTPQERAVLGLAAAVTAHTHDNLLASRAMMRAIVRSPGDRLVTDYGGVFGLYTDASVIEMWGLCNADIALHGGRDGITPVYGKSCPKCVADAAPDYFHTMIPLQRSAGAFKNIDEVVKAVFLGTLLAKYIDFRKEFAVGRVRDTAAGRALWFLERRRPNIALVPRDAQPGLVVDYPFESGGTRP